MYGKQKQPNICTSLWSVHEISASSVQQTLGLNNTGIPMYCGTWTKNIISRYIFYNTGIPAWLIRLGFSLRAQYSKLLIWIKNSRCIFDMVLNTKGKTEIMILWLLKELPKSQTCWHMLINTLNTEFEVGPVAVVIIYPCRLIDTISKNIHFI